METSIIPKMEKTIVNGVVKYKKPKGKDSDKKDHDFLHDKTPLVFKNYQEALAEERQAAAAMVKLAKDQINKLQQRINNWNQIRIENEKIAFGQ